MASLLHAPVVLALLLACVAAPAALPAQGSACARTAQRPSEDPRIVQAIGEARRQHQWFGGQVIERNGGLFHIGYHEAEWSRPPGESTGAWQRVATFWRALSDTEPPLLRTSLGWVQRAEVLHGAATGDASRAEVAQREALLRAAIVDTPWSAAFISYVMKTAGFSRSEFAFSDSHAEYVQAALDASAAEAAGRASPYAFRACDVATTRPRAGDLLCATRADTSAVVQFDALPAALAERAGQPFPMHCELVVRADEGGDAKLETIGGNVVQSVTLSRMTLNANKVLGEAYRITARGNECARATEGCRGHLSRRPWLVLLQLRN